MGINTDGTLEVFAIGPDHAIWHNRQTTAGGPNWSGWSSLGGQAADDPAVGVNADGRLEVFIHTSSGAIWHVWESSPSGNWASGDQINGATGSAPSIGRNSDGRLVVFTADSSGRFWWTIQNSAGADSWAPWSSMQGGTVAAPAVGTNSDGTLQLFAILPDNSFWTSAQTAPGSSSWTAWSSLGGGVSGTPAVVRNTDGRLEAFVHKTDNSLVHMWQTSPGGTWSVWSSLGGIVTNSPVAIVDASGLPQIFVGGGNSSVWYIGASSSAATPQDGWWWDPNLSGMGFFVETGGQSGNGIFMGGFFSDSSGNPTWMVSTGQMDGSTYRGNWLRATGGQPLMGNYQSPVLAAGSAVSVTFTDATHGVLTRPDGSTINLQRYLFSTAGDTVPETGAPQIGWWWGGTALSGSGYGVEFQGSSVFIAAYVYDTNGNPVWYLATGNLTSPMTYTGTWDSYTGGPQLTSPEGKYNSRKTGSATSVTITFTDATHGTMSMGAATIPITRFQQF